LARETVTAHTVWPKKARMKPPKEKEIQSAILSYLRLKKCVAVKVGSGAFKIGDRFIKMGAIGVSDIIACCPPHGRYLAIEVKKQGRYPTPEQRVFLESIHKAGGIGIVARSIDDVEKALAGINL